MYARVPAAKGLQEESRLHSIRRPAAAIARPPDERIPLLFESKFRGHGDFDYWTINGKSFPATDTIRLQEGKCYRLSMTNTSTDDHPVHLHRNVFELTGVHGKQTSGVMKDVVLVKGFRKIEADFTPEMTGLTLFHCHQQLHMDFGFKTVFNVS